MSFSLMVVAVLSVMMGVSVAVVDAEVLAILQKVGESQVGEVLVRDLFGSDTIKDIALLFVVFETHTLYSSVHYNLYKFWIITVEYVQTMKSCNVELL